MKHLRVVNVMAPKRISVTPVQEVENLDVLLVLGEVKKDVLLVVDLQKKDVGVAPVAAKNHLIEMVEQFTPNVVLVAEEVGIHVVLAAMDM